MVDRCSRERGNISHSSTTCTIFEFSSNSRTEPLLATEDKPSTLSPNVPRTLIYTTLAFTARSLWSQSVLANLVFLLTSHSPTVGYVSAVMGLVQLLVSIPAAYVADRSQKREYVLRVASVLGILAIFVTLAAILKTLHFPSLVAALAVWGAFWGTSNTALGALFADSIPNGLVRSHYETQRSILINVGNTAGPLVALAMFQFLGNEWTVHDCVWVLATGQVVAFPAVLLLCTLSDKYTLVSNEESTVLSERDNCCGYGPEQLDAQEITNCDHLTPPLGGDDHDVSTDDIGTTMLPKHRFIPILIASADLMSGLASGMSIRYFPIFFVQHLHLGPVMVQVLYVVAPLGQATLLYTAQKLSQTWGRCRVAVLFKWIGITLMCLMIILDRHHCNVATICIVYVLRTAFMNSTSALTRSFLLDHVPSEERAQWTALESLNMFGWSGSALLGGWLLGLGVNLRELFAITAAWQFLATVPLLFLWARDTNNTQMDAQSMHSVSSSEEN